MRSNITLFQIGFSFLRQKKTLLGVYAWCIGCGIGEKLMFDKYLLSMELISINSKICFKLSVHRLVPIRRVLQIYAHIWNFNAERLDVNLVESIYGKVKKKIDMKKRSCFRIVFSVYLFFFISKKLTSIAHLHYMYISILYDVT